MAQKLAELTVLANGNRYEVDSDTFLLFSKLVKPSTYLEHHSVHTLTSLDAH
jgi:hypothetical protein